MLYLKKTYVNKTKIYKFLKKSRFNFFFNSLFPNLMNSILNYIHPCKTIGKINNIMGSLRRYYEKPIVDKSDAEQLCSMSYIDVIRYRNALSSFIYYRISIALFISRPRDTKFDSMDSHLHPDLYIQRIILYIKHWKK